MSVGGVGVCGVCVCVGGGVEYTGGSRISLKGGGAQENNS